MRTALGLLAILVAVATICIVVTALDGVKEFARVSAERAFGSDTFVVAQVASSGQISRRELEEKLKRHLPIRRGDVRFLERQNEGRVLYAPNAQRGGDVTRGSFEFENAAITGTTADLAAIRDLGIVSGRFFDPTEDVRGAQVVVVGADVVDALFPSGDPVGQAVRVAGRGFTVIGVQGRLGTSGGASLDRSVWMPLVAFERAFGAPATLQVFARADAGVSVQEAEDAARITMRARRNLAPGETDTFDILTPDSARSFVQRVTERTGVAAVPIAVMALLAAIVVVTNTTLVSVSQRTREIGVRRALGATRTQISYEVIAESLIVAIGGGTLGLLLVLALTSVAGEVAGLALRVRPSTMAWSLLASVVSGLAAGWYPARRAVKVDVISAIRTD
ncbi:MAG: ABC transporter permease [Acidobacteria bacterium]|nr:ABC transporter permease [Acidobacteriota bacterium]